MWKFWTGIWGEARPPVVPDWRSRDCQFPEDDRGY